MCDKPSYNYKLRCMDHNVVVQSHDALITVKSRSIRPH